MTAIEDKKLWQTVAIKTYITTFYKVLSLRRQMKGCHGCYVIRFGPDTAPSSQNTKLSNTLSTSSSQLNCSCTSTLNENTQLHAPRFTAHISNIALKHY